MKGKYRIRKREPRTKTKKNFTQGVIGFKRDSIVGKYLNLFAFNIIIIIIIIYRDESNGPLGEERTAFTQRQPPIKGLSKHEIT